MINTSDLKVGQFAERNKNIIYRFSPKHNISGYTKIDNWLNGISQIEYNSEKPLWHSLNNWTVPEELCTLIENPEKKHIDNAIAILKDNLKNGYIDNLTYLENFNILKNYLKSDIVSED